MREHRTVHGAFVRFPGTLYEVGLSPDPGQVLAVKIEVDTNPPAGAVTDATLVLGIPGHSDHRFRSIPITDSGANRSPIPAQTGQ